MSTSGQAKHEPAPAAGLADAAARWIALWFGCGLAPFAPGTAGSIAAVAIAAALAKYAGFAAWHLAIAAAALTPVGIWAAGREERAWGKKDPNRVVVDEVAGQWLAIAGAAHLNWQALAAALVLFRLFDIRKPFPIDRLQSLPGGWGIMADDIVAGAYGALVLYVAGCFNFY